MRPGGNTRASGWEAETAAARALLARGYRLVERNFRTPFGEVDIIARHEGRLVFVEVKSRKDLRAGHPAEAVTPAKQRRLQRAALHYLKHTGQPDHPLRFDVVCLLDDEAGGEPIIDIIEKAF